MKKEIAIGFRTDKDIRNALEIIAEEERRTLSSVIESILYNYVKEKNLLPKTKKKLIQEDSE